MPNYDNSKPRIALELYGIVPSAIALLCLAIERDFSGTPVHKLTLEALLALFVLFSFPGDSFAPFFVAVFICADKTLFHQPLIESLGAWVLGLILVVSTSKNHRASVFRAVLFFLALGTLPIFYTALVLPVLIANLFGAAVGLFMVSRHWKHIEFFLNPWLHITGAQERNRFRFSFFCVYFLSFGATSWSYLVQHTPVPALAAAIHLLCTLLFVPLVLSWLGLEPDLPSEHPLVPTIASARDQAVGPLAAHALGLPQAASLRIKQTLDYMIAERRLEIDRLKKLTEVQKVKAVTELAEELAQKEREAAHQLEDAFYAQPWDLIVSHLSSAPRVTIPGGPTLDLADHLFIGTRKMEQGPHQYEPIFIHKEVLHQHVHVLGGTGSGKTSLGIAPIAVQLLRQRSPNPLIILDMKGEPWLFHTIREEAERNGQDFLFFTIESNRATCRFNPFIGIKEYGGNINEQAQPILQALALDHGEGYGKSFFSRESRSLLFEAFEADRNIHSFGQLKEQLLAKHPAGSKQRSSVSTSKQRSELVAAIDGISRYPQLFTTPEEEKAGGLGIINFRNVLEKNQVVYFWLPAPTQAMSVREVGKLVLYNLFFAAIQRRDQGGKKQAYLFIDEFQRIIGENLALFLEQARSYGIGLTLSNQNIDQLKTPDLNLWPIVRGNVRASLHFGSGDEREIDLISKASGETVAELLSQSTGDSIGKGGGKTAGTTVGISETASNTESEIHSAGSSFSYTEGSFFGPFPSSNEGRSVNDARGTANTSATQQSHSRNESASETWTNGSSKEITRTQYIRPRLRPEDVASIFNKPQNFIYWVLRAVPNSLVDFDGKPITVKGMYSMPKHVFENRDRTPWPRVPGTSILSAEEYVESKTVIEPQMVQTFFDALQPPY